MKEIDRRKIDVLHLHGYGATTFGRLAAKFTRLPVVLHEHANLTATPWFQQVADRLLAGTTDIALAVSESTAEFVRGPRKVPAERVKVVYLGAPLEEFSRVRAAPPRSPPRGRSWASRRTTSPSARSPGCTTRRATSSWSRRRATSSPPGRRRASCWSARGRCSTT